MRKTFNVEEYRLWANHVLSNDIGDQEYRKGIIRGLEMILMSSGNYHGFRYLKVDEVPMDQMPGIYWSVIDGQSVPGFDQTDATRVHYF